MNRVCPHCGKVIEQSVRLSVTVPDYLAQWARRHAKATGVPISAVIADALRLHRDSGQVAA